MDQPKQDFPLQFKNQDSYWRWLALLLGWAFTAIAIYALQTTQSSQFCFYSWGIPVIIVLSLLFSSKLNHELIRLSKKQFIGLVLAAFMLPRLLWLLAVPTQLYIDFATFDHIAGLLSKFRPIQEKIEMHMLLPAWGYPLILAGWYRVVGHSLAAGKLLNLLASTLSVLILYRLARYMGGEQVARVATILFVFWPAQIMLSSVLASEYIATLTILSAFLLLLKVLDSERFDFSHTILASSLFAISFILRSALITAFTTGLLVLSLSGRRPRWKLITASLMIAGFLILYSVYLGGMKSVYQVTPKSQGWFNLMVGANYRSKGFWNQQDSRRFFSYPSMEEANQFARQVSFHRITSNPLRFARLMANKVLMTWSDGTYGFYFSTQKLGASPFASWIISNAALFQAITQTYQLSIFLFAIIGCFRIFQGKAAGFHLAIAFLLAGTALHAVVETQPRYHFVLFPMLLILAAVGISGIFRNTATDGSTQAIA